MGRGAVQRDAKAWWRAETVNRCNDETVPIRLAAWVIRRSVVAASEVGLSVFSKLLP